MGYFSKEYFRILRSRRFFWGHFPGSLSGGGLPTIGATLLYGQLLLFILPALKARQWRLLSVFGAVSLVALVDFSRIALGAHFLTDVLASVFFVIIWLAFCLFATKPILRGMLRSFFPMVMGLSSHGWSIQHTGVRISSPSRPDRRITLYRSIFPGAPESVSI